MFSKIIRVSWVVLNITAERNTPFQHYWAWTWLPVCGLSRRSCACWEALQALSILNCLSARNPAGERKDAETASPTHTHLFRAPPWLPSMQLWVKLGNRLSRTFLLAWYTVSWKFPEYNRHEPEYQTKFKGHGHWRVALDFQSAL